MHKEQHFTWRPSPFLDHSFLICIQGMDGVTRPVGDYTLLDLSEPRHLTEKKLMNLVSLMNGDNNLIPLGLETQSRLLFHRKPKTEDDPRSQIVFYTFKGEGLSKENALLTMEGEWNA